MLGCIGDGPALYGHGSRYVADGHLVRQLLQPQLLVLDELGPPRLHLYAAFGFVIYTTL